ncbi:L,D-transpeptidase [Enterococcus sp. AZ109]|uniref:L,D-transpeptidase n=1 Tax=Enterococcus sp. AZ109 TaxID=2774634 RepID=UPI003F21B23B
MKKFVGFICLILMFVIPATVYLAESQETQEALTAISSIFEDFVSSKDNLTKSIESTTNSEVVTSGSTEEVQTVKNKLNEPSEAKSYPELTPDDWIDVSINDQKVYFKRGDEILYTMNCSTGLEGESATPLGEFVIEPERGETFYNQATGEGANYWVSWRDHGVYLFHTVPIDENGNYIESEAETLGVRPSSHGCIRLSVPDAKWIYDTVPMGMRVVVRE